jgi:hypothetical protein
MQTRTRKETIFHAINEFMMDYEPIYHKFLEDYNSIYYSCGIITRGIRKQQECVGRNWDWNPEENVPGVHD